MTSTEQAKAYALEKLGLDWARLDKWSDDEKRAYLSAVAEFRRDNPDLFSIEQLAAAENYASAATVKDPEFSYVGEFFKEAGAQVSNLNDELNPFAEANRSRTRNTVIAAVLLAAVAYFGVLAVRTSPRNPSNR